MMIEHNSQTIRLLKSIGYPLHGDLQFSKPVASRDLYQLARSNKIGSLYTNSLSNNNALDNLSDEYINRREFQERLSETYGNISNNFPGEYVVVKTAQPFWADSSDIDILTDQDLFQLKSQLISSGYDISGMAPTALSVRDKKTDILIDIQSDFGLFKVKYHDRNTIEKEHRKIKTHTLPVTTRSSDIALQIDHSLTELIFILKEYYSAVYFLENSSRDEVDRMLRLVRENKSMTGAQAFFTIILQLSKKAFDLAPQSIDYILKDLGVCSATTNALRSTDYELPFRYPKRVLMKYTLEKFSQNSFRNSFIEQMPYMANPKIVYYLTKKVYDRGTRSDYIEESYD